MKIKKMGKCNRLTALTSVMKSTEKVFIHDKRLLALGIDFAYIIEPRIIIAYFKELRKIEKSKSVENEKGAKKW